MTFDLASLIDAKTLVGLLLGSFLVWFGEFVKARYIRSKQAHYLAVRLIPILEQFLDECYRVAFDDGTADGQPAGYSKEGQFSYYEIQTEVPELILPSDVDWQSIDKKLVESIMAISSEMHRIKKRLENDPEIWHGDQSEGIYVRQVEYSHFSIKVDDVLSGVKKIISRKIIRDENYDPRKRCEEFVEKAKENAIKVEQAREKLRMEMNEAISQAGKESK